MKLSTASFLLLGATLPFSAVESRGHRSVGGDDRLLGSDDLLEDGALSMEHSKIMHDCHGKIQDIINKYGVSGTDPDHQELEEKMEKVCEECDEEGIAKIMSKMNSLGRSIKSDKEKACDEEDDIKCYNYESLLEEHNTKVAEVDFLAEEVCGNGVTVVQQQQQEEPDCKSEKEALEQAQEQVDKAKNEFDDCKDKEKKAQDELTAKTTEYQPKLDDANATYVESSKGCMNAKEASIACINGECGVDDEGNTLSYEDCEAAEKAPCNEMVESLNKFLEYDGKIKAHVEEYGAKLKVQQLECTDIFNMTETIIIPGLKAANNTLETCLNTPEVRRNLRG